MQNKNKYEGIIFDMDGTIADTEQIWLQSLRLFLHSQNIKDEVLILKIYNQIRGLSGSLLEEKIKDLGQIKTLTPKEIRSDMNRISESLFHSEIKYIDGFLDFIDKIKKYGLPVAIATNADSHGLKKTNDILRLEDHFGQHMYSISCVNNVCKPLPDIYLHAAKNINIDPVLCLAIEDSVHGATAAINAGMFCVGINTANIRDDLSKVANIVIDKYEEIEINNFFKINKIL